MLAGTWREDMDSLTAVWIFKVSCKLCLPWGRAMLQWWRYIAKSWASSATDLCEWSQSCETHDRSCHKALLILGMPMQFQSKQGQLHGEQFCFLLCGARISFRRADYQKPFIGANLQAFQAASWKQNLPRNYSMLLLAACGRQPSCGMGSKIAKAPFWEKWALKQ